MNGHASKLRHYQALKTVHIAAPALILFALWLLLSGHYTPLLLGLGAVSSVALAWLATRLGVLNPRGGELRFTLRFLRYLPWLVWQVIQSNLDVARRVLNPRLPISPTIVRVRASQKGAAALVVHANSITLTPGTLSLEALDDEGAIEVHALAEELATDLTEGEMDRRVRALEGG